MTERMLKNDLYDLSNELKLFIIWDLVRHVSAGGTLILRHIWIRFAQKLQPLRIIGEIA